MSETPTMDFVYKLLVALIIMMLGFTGSMYQNINKVHEEVEAVNISTLEIKGSLDSIQTELKYITKDTDRINNNLTNHIEYARKQYARKSNHNGER